VYNATVRHYPGAVWLVMVSYLVVAEAALYWAWALARRERGVGVGVCGEGGEEERAAVGQLWREPLLVKGGDDEEAGGLPPVVVAGGDR
jgi:hypothetical protein